MSHRFLKFQTAPDNTTISTVYFALRAVQTRALFVGDGMRLAIAGDEMEPTPSLVRQIVRHRIDRGPSKHHEVGQ
jgi:hypothetical protein